MNLPIDLNHLFLAAVLFFIIWRFFKFKKTKEQVPGLIKEGAIIVDVRSQSEFQSGATPGSINIPLNELPGRLSELSRDKVILLCCASGSRSGMAVGILKSNGFKKVINAGPWRNTLH